MGSRSKSRASIRYPAGSILHIKRRLASGSLDSATLQSSRGRGIIPICLISLREQVDSEIIEQAQACVRARARACTHIFKPVYKLAHRRANQTQTALIESAFQPVSRTDLCRIKPISISTSRVSASRYSRCIAIAIAGIAQARLEAGRLGFQLPRREFHARGIWNAKRYTTRKGGGERR